MRPAGLLVATVALFALIGRAAADGQAPSATLAVSADTRLIVIAPHPDDETLGAGGLMQRVRTAGGALHIIYLTDGDGYPEGVKVYERVSVPKAADYRHYGRLRRREAQSAMASLALGAPAATFLSFPDGGLRQLITKYWSERGPAFHSPYTR